MVLARRWPLAGSEHADLTPAGLWGDPSVSIEPGPDDGPVLITIEYEIDRVDAERFVAAMDRLGRVRRRDGAYRWELYADLERPGPPLHLDEALVGLEQLPQMPCQNLGAVETLDARAR